MLGPTAAAQVEDVAARLVLRGDVVQNRRGQYCLREQLPGLVVGTVSGHRDGHGWVLPDDARRRCSLPSQMLREVMHGDRVAVRVRVRIIAVARRAPSSRCSSGARARSSAACTSRPASRSSSPDNPRISHRVFVPCGAWAPRASRPGRDRRDHASSRAATRRPVGRVTRVLGEHGSPGMETEIAIHSHGLPFEFPPEVLAEAEAYGRAHPRRGASRAARTCARPPLVTIDGEDARDFDDAVYCERASGGWRLIVAIADVGHYVQPGSALDARSARARHVRLLSEPRAADAARGAVERAVLADSGGRSARAWSARCASARRAQSTRRGSSRP